MLILFCNLSGIVDNLLIDSCLTLFVLFEDLRCLEEKIRLGKNALTFELKLFCVLSQTHLRLE